MSLTYASCVTPDNNQETDRVRPWPGNPHYLTWGNTPVFLIGPTGYHGWTPISRPGEMDFHMQLHRLDKVIRDAGSMHVCGFVRCIPYDPMNHMHDAVESLPEGAGANVLADADRHYVVQLIGGAAGKYIGLSLPNGIWSVSWSDPSTEETLVCKFALII